MRRDSGERGEREDDRPWDVRILERIDAGVDGSLIGENLSGHPQNDCDVCRTG